MGYYITQAHIEARASTRVVRQVMDDNRDGAADAGPIAQLIMDSESYAEEIVGGIYDLAEVRAAAPNAMQRLCLDVAVAYLRERWPSYTRQVAAKSWERLRAECEQVSLSVRRVDAGGVTSPPANVGGLVEQGVAVDPNAGDAPRLWDFGTTGFF